MISLSTVGNYYASGPRCSGNFSDIDFILKCYKNNTQSFCVNHCSGWFLYRQKVVLWIMAKCIQLEGLSYLLTVKSGISATPTEPLGVPLSLVVSFDSRYYFLRTHLFFCNFLPTLLLLSWLLKPFLTILTICFSLWLLSLFLLKDWVWLFSLFYHVNMNGK